MFANVILERSLPANEGHNGVNESILIIKKQIWTQMKGYFFVNEHEKVYTCMAVSHKDWEVPHS